MILESEFENEDTEDNDEKETELLPEKKTDNENQKPDPIKSKLGPM
jgi:hypothetical protein